jgi:hypothetical protein
MIVLMAMITTSQQTGGSRDDMFSRFNYIPDFPMISQLDQVDLDRYSKVYNHAGPLKLIMGRPYRFYDSYDSTWLYPWHFPEEIDKPCLQEASTRCHEPIVMIKKETDKLGGLGVLTPADLVHVSPCFDETYQHCLRGERSPP